MDINGLISFVLVFFLVFYLCSGSVYENFTTPSYPQVKFKVKNSDNSDYGSKTYIKVVSQGMTLGANVTSCPTLCQFGLYQVDLATGNASNSSGIYVFLNPENKILVVKDLSSKYAYFSPSLDVTSNNIKTYIKRIIFYDKVNQQIFYNPSNKKYLVPDDNKLMQGSNLPGVGYVGVWSSSIQKKFVPEVISGLL